MHYQKLAHSLHTMFPIVEKIIFLTSFDARPAHAGTSVVFSSLVFHNFNFCLRKFNSLITLKKQWSSWKFCTIFACEIYISLSIPPKLLFVYSTKIYSQFSTLRPVADLELLQHLQWSFFVTAVTTSSTIHVAVLEVDDDRVLCLWSVTNATHQPFEF